MNSFTEEELKITTDEAVLRQVSRATSFAECLSLKLFDRLREALKKSWTPGIGLAAIQIGVPVRFAYYKDPSRPEGPPKYLLNPKLLYGQMCGPHNDEGCLSIKDRRFKAWRYQKITYLNEVHGKPEEFTARGFEAYVVQHEIDHMNGVLCCDRTEKPAEPGRNDACPCGSEKKFKKCCEQKGMPL